MGCKIVVDDEDTKNFRLSITKAVKITLTKEVYERIKNYEGHNIVLGIRPGDLKLVDEFNENTCVKCRVDVVEALGSETIIYATLNLTQTQNITEVSSTSITASIKRIKVERNSELCFEFDFNNICLFDRITEESLKK